MRNEEGKASSPVQTYGVLFNLPGNGLESGMFNSVFSSASFKGHLLQIPQSEFRPFIPMSTYRNSYSGPIMANSIILSVP